MGGFKIIEDRPTPKCVYNARVYLQATVVGESPCELLGFNFARNSADKT